MQIMTSWVTVENQLLVKTIQGKYFLLIEGDFCETSEEDAKLLLNV